MIDAVQEKTKFTLLLGLIIASFVPLPLVAGVTSDTFTSLEGAALYISTLLGYIGLVLLLWMYILGPRTVIGLYFADMAGIHRLHSLFGKYGLLFVFAHPFAVALSYGYNLILYPFVPDISSNFEFYVTLGRLAFYILIIIWVTSAIIKGKIAYRPWKYLHHIAYLALPLTLLHIPTVGTAFRSGELLPQIYFFSILGIYILFSILNYRQFFGYGKLAMTIVSQTPATDDVMVLRLKTERGKRLDSARGQFLYLQMRLIGEAHPFSILRYDKATGDVMVGYKKFGRFTKKLSRLEPGNRLWIDGPYGVFTREIETTPQDQVVCIAGGIGITPFIDRILGGTSKPWLFYANQTVTSAAFTPAIAQALGERYVPIYSNDTVDGAESGFMRADIITKYIENPQSKRYFICGPPKMMEATKRMLIGLGVPAHHIYSEDFSF